MILRKRNLIIVLLSITLLSTGCSNSIDKNKVVAEVNGENITVGYFEKTLKLQEQAMTDMYGKDIWEKEIKKGITFKDEFKNQVIEQIISMDSIYDEAKKENILPTEEEINERFEYVKKSIDSNEDYKENLKKIGINDEFIKEQQAKDLAMEKYKDKFYEDVKVSDEEIKSYYDKNKSEFSTEQVKASHILISINDENDKPLPDKEKKEAKQKAEDILNQIKSGAKFEELAKINSSCPSGINGGDLGYFGKGKMVPTFEESAFSLNKGDISDIVETNFGYHIIKVTDKKNNQRPFEEVRDYIKMKIKDEKFDSKLKEIEKNANIKKNQEVIEEVAF